VYADICERKNLLVAANSLPLETLCIVLTFLPTQRDRFIAASVCRRWRKTFLGYGPTWSKVFTDRDYECVETLLDRAKEYPLDVVVGGEIGSSTIQLLTAKAHQIQRLEFERTHLEGVLDVSEAISGNTLLSTLKVAIDSRPVNLPEDLPPFLNGAGKLAHFVFLGDPEYLPLFSRLGCLSTLEATIQSDCSFLPPLSHLLDFLKASPTLRTVEVKIPGGVFLDDGAAWEVVDLPNLKTLSISAECAALLYKLAVHISCHGVGSVYLNHVEQDWGESGLEQEVVPDGEFWQTIAGHYASGPVEEVKVEAYHNKAASAISALLTLLSSDGKAVKLRFDFFTGGWCCTHDENIASTLAVLRALKAVRDRPPSDIQRLHIQQCCVSISPSPYTSALSQEFTAFFGHIGRLQCLTLQGGNLHVFNTPDDQGRTVEFPDTNELVVSDWSGPWTGAEEWNEHAASLIRSQHKRHKQFKRVTICAPDACYGMEEWLDKLAAGRVVLQPEVISCERSSTSSDPWVCSSLCSQWGKSVLGPSW
jgi:hypothetical protein